MSVLVIADHDNKALRPATRSAITAARALGDATVLVAGRDCRAVADDAAGVAGVAKVLLADSPTLEHGQAEALAPMAAEMAKDFGYVLAPATSNGKNITPRIAALLDVAQISDITAIETEDTFVRPIYAGNALATVRSNDPIKVATVRATAFPPAPNQDVPGEIEEISPPEDPGLSRFVARKAGASGRTDLASARIVVAGGRGVGGAEGFGLIEGLADKLGAAVGASRAAVDAGYATNDMQVGQTGKVVAPDLYIAVGVSGAIQHLAGMKDSKIIVAINKDEDAPIFDVADYGLVADLFTALPELSAELDKRL